MLTGAGAAASMSRWHLWLVGPSLPPPELDLLPQPGTMSLLVLLAAPTGPAALWLKCWGRALSDPWSWVTMSRVP